MLVSLCALSLAALPAAPQLPDHDLTPGAALHWEQRLDQVQGAAETPWGLVISPSHVVEVASVRAIAGVGFVPAGTRVRGLHRSDGALAWTRPDLFAAPGAAPQLEEVLEVVGSPGGGLFVVRGRDAAGPKLAAYDSNSGARLWLLTEAELPGLSTGFLNDRCIDPAGSLVSIRLQTTAPGGAAVLALRLSDGSTLWRNDTLSGPLAGYSRFGLAVASSDALFVQCLRLNLFLQEVASIARLDATTGALLFDAPLLNGAHVNLELDPAEQRLAAGSGELDFFGSGISFYGIEFLDADTGVVRGFQGLDGQPAGFEFSASGSRLVALTTKVSTSAGVVMRRATAFGIDPATATQVWEHPLQPSFGSDSVGKAQLRMDPLGRALIALGRSPVTTLLTGAQSTTELQALNPLNGAVVAAIPIDLGPSLAQFVSLEADASGPVLHSNAGASPLDNPGARIDALGPFGALDWSAEGQSEASANQRVATTASTSDGAQLLVLETVNSGQQVRAVDGATGAPLWETPLDFLASAGSGFVGGLLYSSDESVVGVLVPTRLSEPNGSNGGLFLALDSNDGAVLWTYKLPDLRSASTNVLQRRGIAYDALRDHWLLGGGADEDVLYALDAAGQLVWQQVVPTPTAAGASVFDRITDLTLAESADLLIVTGNYLDAGSSSDLDPYVMAFDPATGALVWSQLPSDDATTTFPAPEYPASLAVDEPTGRVTVSIQVGQFIALNMRARVLSFDLTTGAPQWERSFLPGADALNRPQIHRSALDGQRIVVAGEPERSTLPRTLELVALDPDGQTVWETSIDPETAFEVRDLVPSADGTVLFGCAATANDFTLLPTGTGLGSLVFAVDAIDGQVLWSDRWTEPTDGDEIFRQLQLTDLELAGPRLFASGWGYLEPESLTSTDLHLLAYDLPTLTGDAAELSLSAGGTLALELRAGVTSNTDTYLVLGSLTGTAGLPLGAGLVLPLTSDAWTVTTAQSPNTGALTDTLGSLDPSGRAAASITVPVGLSPTLSGVVAHHAYLTLDPIAGVFVLVSNPVSTALIP